MSNQKALVRQMRSCWCTIGSVLLATPTAGWCAFHFHWDLTPRHAREASVVIDEITQAGLDIDQGMVVKMGGRLYYGTEAIHTLALTNSRADLFNKLTYYAFRLDRLSRILYPALRTCRNLLLKVMRRTKINNLRATGNDRF